MASPLPSSKHTPLEDASARLRLFHAPAVARVATGDGRRRRHHGEVSVAAADVGSYIHRLRWPGDLTPRHNRGGGPRGSEKVPVRTPLLLLSLMT